MIEQINEGKIRDEAKDYVNRSKKTNKFGRIEARKRIAVVVAVMKSPGGFRMF